MELRRNQPRSIIAYRPRASFLGLSTLSVVTALLLMLLHGSVDAVKLQGGSALALAGKGCVVLAMDQRVGTRYEEAVRGWGGGINEGVCQERLRGLRSRRAEGVNFSLWHSHTVANSCWVGIGAGTRPTASAGASGCSRYVRVGVMENRILRRGCTYNLIANSTIPAEIYAYASRCSHSSLSSSFYSISR